MSSRARSAGRAALAALRAGPATVLARFERSCYVETPAGIACLGADIGLGPLNVLMENFEIPEAGEKVGVDLSSVVAWRPESRVHRGSFPAIGIPRCIRTPARAFLDWIEGGGAPDDSLIGLGPGLTPAGDDFVGGAMIALRAIGEGDAADRIAGWALPLAGQRTSRISRAHLECAAAGEGHAALHDYLRTSGNGDLERLSRVGHTSGLDAAAGALHALRRTTA